MIIHTNLLYLENITRNILIDNHGKINCFSVLYTLYRAVIFCKSTMVALIKREKIHF